MLLTSNIQNINEDVRLAVEILRKGGVILYPTDTIWGIGCDATNSEAVRRIFEIKHRADSKALITLVNSESMLERYVANVPEVAWQLIEAAVHPLTIVYDHAVGVAPELLANDGSIGVRLTHEKYSASLCQALHRPIVSTSANISGDEAPKIFGDISDEIIDAVNYVATYRRDDTSVTSPSNVIKLSDNGVVKILR